MADGECTWLRVDSRAHGTPCIAISRKCDLEKQILMEEAARTIESAGCRHIEVSQLTGDGRRRMRKAFDVLIQQVIALPGEFHFLRMKSLWCLTMGTPGSPALTLPGHVQPVGSSASSQQRTDKLEAPTLSVQTRRDTSPLTCVPRQLTSAGRLAPPAPRKDFPFSFPKTQIRTAGW